jgi:hypothetical protein
MLHWMSGMSANLCPFKAFILILERAKNRKGRSEVNKVNGPFLLMDFIAGNSRTLKASCAGAVSWRRMHLSGQSLGLFLKTDSRNLVSIFK